MSNQTSGTFEKFYPAGTEKRAKTVVPVNTTTHNDLTSKLNAISNNARVHPDTNTNNVTSNAASLKSPIRLSRALSDLSNLHSDAHEIDDYLNTGVKPKQLAIQHELLKSSSDTTVITETETAINDTYLPIESIYPPFDYSLVFRCKFVSEEPFDWLYTLNPTDRNKILHQLDYDSSNEKLTTEQQYCKQFLNNLSIYQHPAKCYNSHDSEIQNYLVANDKLLDDRTDNDHNAIRNMYQRRYMYIQAHQSLHQSYLRNDIQYYYIVINQLHTTALFTKRYVGDSSDVENIAILSKATRKLRELMTSNDIPHTDVHWSDKDKYSHDTPIVITNTDDDASIVNTFSTILDEMIIQHDDIPLLVSTKQFQHSTRTCASFNTDTIKHSLQTANTQYTLNITGLLLPYNITKIYHLLQKTQQDNYTVSLSHETEYKQSHGLQWPDSIRDIGSSNCNLIQQVCNNQTNDTPITNHRQNRCKAVYSNTIVQRELQAHIEHVRKCSTLSVKRVQCSIDNKSTLYRIGLV